MKKNNTVTCKLNQDEMKLLNTLVMQSGCSSRSEFIRKMIFQESEANISNKDFFKILLHIKSLIRINREEIYVTRKLVSACLQEISRKEHINYQEMVIGFIKEAEEEAKLLSEKEDE